MELCETERNKSLLNNRGRTYSLERIAELGHWRRKINRNEAAAIPPFKPHRRSTCGGHVAESFLPDERN